MLILDAREASAALKKLGDDLPRALATGLNRTMAAIEQHQLVAMERTLDRPTPFTLNALRRFDARPDRLNAVMFVQPIQAKYLAAPIEGATLPTSITPVIRHARLNPHGNLPGKRRGLSGVRGTARRKFVGTVNGTLGVYERIGPQGRRLRTIAKVERNARREKRWPYYETAERVAADRLRDDIHRAIAEQLP